MGLIYRCTSCSGEMVLESYHRGRTVPCPTCREPNEVPRNLDFREVARATARDANTAALLMTFTVVGFVTCLCVPLNAFLWWYTAGRIQRAREEQREVDGLLVVARWMSAAATIGGLLAGGAIFVGSLG